MAKIRGGEKLERRLAEITAALKDKGTLQVGFLENAKYPDGTPVALIGAIQNFGAPKVGIPPRPFFDRFISKNSAQWPGTLKTLLKANNYNLKKVLKLMGELLKSQLQQAIQDMNSPPLKPSTLRSRGVAPSTKYNPKDTSTFGAKPLVRSGHMQNSVDYAVKD